MKHCMYYSFSSRTQDFNLHADKCSCNGYKAKCQNIIEFMSVCFGAPSWQIFFFVCYLLFLKSKWTSWFVLSVLCITVVYLLYISQFCYDFISYLCKKLIWKTFFQIYQILDLSLDRGLQAAFVYSFNLLEVKVDLFRQKKFCLHLLIMLFVSCSHK